MSDYCTNCKWLGKETNANKTNWFCRKESKIGYVLRSLCGNPTKIDYCRKWNWYELKIKQQEKKMTTEEMIKVMQAYVDGKQIQSRQTNTNIEFKDDDTPTFNFFCLEYRIKPEPKYRPLKPEEFYLLKDRWIKSRDGRFVGKINLYGPIVVTMGENTYNGKDLLKDWTYEDGTPVGRIIEE